MPEITIAGQTFPLKATPPKTGRLLLVARAERRRDETGLLAAYLELLEELLDEDVDRLAFEDAISQVDLEDIGRALEASAKTFEVDPTSAGPTPSSDSSDGSQNGPATSRVVSFSRGTVEEVTTAESLTG